MSRYIVPAKPQKAHGRRQRAKRSNSLDAAAGRACPYCGLIMQAKTYDGPPDPKRTPFAPTRDHVWPQSLGGGPTLICCYWCNNAKGSMTRGQWVAYLARVMPDRAEPVRQLFLARGFWFGRPETKKPSGVQPEGS